MPVVLLFLLCFKFICNVQLFCYVFALFCLLYMPFYCFRVFETCEFYVLFFLNLLFPFVPWGMGDLEKFKEGINVLGKMMTFLLTLECSICFMCGLVSERLHSLITKRKRFHQRLIEFTGV